MREPKVLDHIDISFVIATKGQRLGNYIIDLIITFLIGIFLVMPLVVRLKIGGNNPEFSIAVYAIVIGIGFWYFTLTEFFLGKSIGKFVTKTIVVTEAGEQPSFINILGRTISRFIPFDPLSFLFSKDGKGWHDRVSKTLVIRDVR